MKILHVTPSIDKVFGGPSEAAINMVDFLNKDGHFVDLLSTLSSASSFEVVDFVRIKERVTLLPRIKIFRDYVPSLKRWLNDNISNYDLVHVHSVFNYTSHVAMNCARIHKIPFILRPAGMLGFYDLNNNKKWLKKFWMNFVDHRNLNVVSAFHTTALYEKVDLEKIFPFSRIEEIPLGINLPFYVVKEQVKDRNFNLLFISRLHKKKNIPAVLEAVSRATLKGIILKLKIAGEPNPGDESYKIYLEKMLQDLKIQGQVEFCGFLSGKAKEEAFNWADVFILPSFSENFGIAVLEALSYSVPVIISPQVALSKEVREFGGGWITDEANPQSADSILKILELINQNKNLIPEESKKARLVAEKFSWEKNAKSLITLYESILNKNSK
jgi:glycosyltransferase involved in cell wall biosynthesis